MKFSPKLVTIFSDEFSVNFSPIMVIFFVNEKISVWLSGQIFIKIGDNNFWRIFCWIFSTFGDFFGNWWFFWEIKKNIGEWLREAPLNFSTGSNGHCPNSDCTPPSTGHSGALYFRTELSNFVKSTCWWL